MATFLLLNVCIDLCAEEIYVLKDIDMHGIRPISVAQKIPLILSCRVQLSFSFQLQSLLSLGLCQASYYLITLNEQR